MAKILVKTYDPFDGYAFDYVAFNDKSSAKAYRRHNASPENVAVSIMETTVNVPVGKVFGDPESFMFLRCERAEMALNTAEWRESMKAWL